MNWSQFFYRYPYQLVWNLRKFFFKKDAGQIDFLCGNIVDYICFKNIHQLMPEVRIVARNSRVKAELEKYGIEAVLYPTFPQVIIMARHLTRKYPHPKIIKIGMTHGAYNFKKLISPKYYNAFDLYLFTSETKLKEAQEAGIHSGAAVGYSKLDRAFSGKNIDLNAYQKKLNLDKSRKTIIFSSTWDKKGYSAIDMWYKDIGKLTAKYNVLVTLHPWVTKEKMERIKNTPGVKYIEDKDILPYLMLSDVMVGDTSSILGEFCALDKPLITFEIPLVGRMTEETRKMLTDISFRVKSFEKLENILPQALANPELHQEKRAKYNNIMFDQLDGKASERAVKKIKKIIKDKS